MAFAITSGWPPSGKAWEEGEWVREAALAHAQNNRPAARHEERQHEQSLLAVI